LGYSQAVRQCKFMLSLKISGGKSNLSRVQNVD
jgi:hypothetical protein